MPSLTEDIVTTSGADAGPKFDPDSVTIAPPTAGSDTTPPNDTMLGARYPNSEPNTTAD
jgi:hypothetical protein